MSQNEEPEQDGTDDPGIPPAFNPVYSMKGGSPFIRLPDGSTIALSDWVYGSFYSAAVVMPYGEEGYSNLEFFANGRSQQLAGAPAGELASYAHTNVVRSGDNGLPIDWEMIVYSWRAQCSLPLEQPVIDYAAECMLQFDYNGKMYRQCRLIELLLGGAELTSKAGTPSLPIHMRQHLQYKVNMVPQSRAVVDRFQEYLRSKTPSVDATVLSELGQLARLAPAPLAAEITRIQKKLQPGRRATFWVSLEGYIKRTIV